MKPEQKRTLVLSILGLIISPILFAFIFGVAWAMGMGGFSYTFAGIVTLIILYRLYKWTVFVENSRNIYCSNCNEKNRVKYEDIWFKCKNCQAEFNFEDNKEEEVKTDV